MLNSSAREKLHPRHRVHDHSQGMRRSYDREVYLRVPAHGIENARHIRPGVDGFDQPHPYNDEHENYDV